MKQFISFFLKFKSNLLVKRFFSLLNAAFAMSILHLILQVQLDCVLIIYVIKRFIVESSAL
jgi:hypothetical protein